MVPNPKDRRGRLLCLTDDGRAALKEALPIWESTHAALEAKLPNGDGDGLRRDLQYLA
ncbi:hypothetical protein D3C87_2156620 [compost metagenome]